MRNGLKVITAKQGFWNSHEKKEQEWQRLKELFNRARCPLFLLSLKVRDCFPKLCNNFGIVPAGASGRVYVPGHRKEGDH